MSGARRALAWALGHLLRAWNASLRFRIAPPDLATLTPTPGAVVFVLWHNRLFVAAEIARRFRPGRHLHALVSASRDGAWLAEYFQISGLRPVRGSTNRQGREAAHALVDVLRRGEDVGITPDGPRGPIYECRPGSLLVARHGRARVLVLGIVYESAWQAPSWDRFFLPAPFSTVHLRCREFPAALVADRHAGNTALAAALALHNPEHLAPASPAVV